MQMMARRKIPITGSVWEGPQWMVGGTPEQGGKTLPRERYDDCIEAVAQFLVTARDKYNAPVDYFSFNEPDYGINFKFTPAQMAEFIRLAGPRFAALGLKTKFLTADTANGSNFVEYARPLLEDKTIAPYLGPLAFHSWDVLGATDEKYTGIAALGRQYNRPVWCTEAGHDAQLWQAQTRGNHGRTRYAPPWLTSAPFASAARSKWITGHIRIIIRSSARMDKHPTPFGMWCARWKWPCHRVRRSLRPQQTTTT
jgi:hypothetical protein